MLFMLKLISFAICCISLFSCVGESGNKFENLLKPGGRLMSYMPQDASDAYKAGWIDGCESGLSIFGHTFQKHFYKFKKDQRFYGTKFGDERDLFNGREITDNDKLDYTAGWGATYSWCRHSTIGIHMGGKNLMRPPVYGDNALGNFGRLHGVDQIYELANWGQATTNGFYENW
jgi:hypothetical protein